jgi:hypothetical protein
VPGPQVTSQAQAVLVSIAYPAKIEDSAERWCAQGAVNTGCPMSLSDARQHHIDVMAQPKNYAGETLTKSLYHAIELKAALEERLPPGSVILSPERVWAEQKGADTMIYQSPMVVPPPSVLRVRLFMRTDIARVAGVEGSGWDTFGAFASPAVSVVRAAPALATSNERMLAGTSCYDEASLVLTAGNMFYSHEGPAKELSRKATDRRPVQKDHYLKFSQGFHVAKGEYDPKLAAQISAGEKALPAGSPYHELWSYFANCIVESLNTVAVSNDFSAIMTAYASDYDRSLSIFTSNGEFKANNEAAAELVAEFYKAECEFVNEQDRDFANTIYQKEFGQNFRQTLKAERSVEDGVDRARERQNQAMMMGALVSTFSTAMAVQGKITPTQNLSNQMTVMQSNNAASAAASAEARALLAAFEHHLGRTREAQFQYVLHANGKEIVVRANSLTDLRAQFKKVYADAFPVTASR